MHGKSCSTCRAIYDQSYEDVAWRVGDNNGMPHDPKTPLSDLAQSIAQHDDPQHPSPTPSSTPSSTDKADSSTDSKQKSPTSRVQSAIRQAAHMDSVGEDEQAKHDKRWQQTPPLQTIALDDNDLPSSTSSRPTPQVGTGVSMLLQMCWCIALCRHLHCVCIAPSHHDCIPDQSLLDLLLLPLPHRYASCNLNLSHGTVDLAFGSTIPVYVTYWSMR